MENKKQFTNEELAKKFRNNFDLVNYAISLAENMIRTGRDPRVRKSEVQNRAMLILEEIREGNDQFDEIPDDSAKFAQEINDIRMHEAIAEVHTGQKGKAESIEIDDDED